MTSQWQQHKFLLLLVIVVVYLSNHCDANLRNTTTLAANEYANSRTLSSSPLLKLYWKANATLNVIEFAVEAQVSGWVSIAFGYTDNGMEQADCYVITVQNGQIIVRDAYLPGGYSPPIYDDQQPNGRNNIIQSTGSFTNGLLIAKFSRNMVLTASNDQYDKPITHTSATRTSWAFNTNTYALSSHSHRGTLTVTYEQEVNNNPTDNGGSKTGHWVVFPFHLLVTGLSIILMIALASGITWIRMCHTNALGHLVFHFKVMDMIAHWISHIQSYLPTIINYYVTEMTELMFDLSVGELFMLFLYFLNGALWFLQGLLNSLAKDETMPVGRAFGLWNIFNLALVMFPVYRYSIWRYTFGISFERSIKFHRFMGIFTIMYIMTVHFILMTVQFKDRIFAWGTTGNEPYINLAGFIAWILFLLMGAFATPLVRRYAFELFYVSHYVFGIPAIVFAIIHVKSHLAYILISLSVSWLLLLVDYVLRLLLAVNGKIVKMEQDELSGVTALHVRVPKRFKFHAGQFALLYIPSVSWTQWHPFSMSCSSIADNDNMITFHIKDMGNGTFTHRLRMLAQQQQVSMGEYFVRLEGPYGTTSISPDDYENIMLVAGGIGVTPMISMLSTLLQHIQNQKTAKLKHVSFVWSVREASLVKMFLPQLQAAQANAACTLHIHVTSKSGSDTLPNGLCKTGRPDMFALAEATKSSSNGYVGVFMCGPDLLLRTTQNACWRASSLTGVQFQIHKETFLL